MYDRILVVGCPASGKSTVARKLVACSGLPLVSLDDLFFNEDWGVPSVEVWIERLDQCVAQPRWVIDGNHQSTFERRLDRAQCVVFLVRSPVRCALSYLWRALRMKIASVRATNLAQFPHYMRSSRGVRVTFKPLQFLVFILKFRAVQHQMENSLQSFSGAVIWVTSRHQVGLAIAATVGGSR